VLTALGASGGFDITPDGGIVAEVMREAASISATMGYTGAGAAAANA
jgi:hypothetical protein